MRVSDRSYKLLNKVLTLPETAVTMRVEFLLALTRLSDDGHAERLHHSVDDLTSLAVHCKMLEKRLDLIHGQDLREAECFTTGD